MKTIIIPTDFSDNALRAFDYARALFGDDPKYVLLNTYVEPRSTSASMVSLRDILHEGSVEGLSELSHQIKNGPNPPPNFETLSEYGDPENAICNAARIHKADLIVMGTKGATGLKEVFMGSVAAGVFQNATCPVIAVPNDAVLRAPKNVLLAADLKSDIEESHKMLLANIIEKNHGSLSILTVDTNGDDISVEEAEHGYDIHVQFQNLEHAFDVVDSEDPESAILEYSKVNEMDMIVTIPRKSGWLKRLIGKSISEKLAEHSNIPVLALKH
ncbi:MAG: universal stress protein [Salibacteraceae bacterium]